MKVPFQTVNQHFWNKYHANKSNSTNVLQPSSFLLLEYFSNIVIHFIKNDLSLWHRIASKKKKSLLWLQQCQLESPLSKIWVYFKGWKRKEPLQAPLSVSLRDPQVLNHGSRYESGIHKGRLWEKKKTEATSTLVPWTCYLAKLPILGTQPISQKKQL